jgi:phosphoribosylaminoimidazole-succinocarboxamide synthase
VTTDIGDLPASAGIGDQLAEQLRGRIMLVERCEPTTVEWVVRGYLAGSGWKEYQVSSTVCGIPLPAGIEFCGKLPEPLLTPTTKDDVHDAPLTPEEARERVGSEIFEAARDASLSLFRHGGEELARIGILLADTKFEFGVRDGRLLLIDEALTQDSSRFWPEDLYQTGRNQPSFDKQILRDWLETLDWDKNYPAPEVPAEIAQRLSDRYLEICERITGTMPAGVKV